MGTLVALSRWGGLEAASVKAAKEIVGDLA